MTLPENLFDIFKIKFMPPQQHSLPDLLTMMYNMFGNCYFAHASVAYEGAIYTHYNGHEFVSHYGTIEEIKIILIADNERLALFMKNESDLILVKLMV